MKNIFVREATSSSRSSMISLLCREENTRPYRGICSHSIEKLKGSGSNVFWGGRGQVSGFSHQRKGGYVYHNGQQSQRSNSNCLIYTEPWCWLVDQGVPRTETERKPIPFSLDMYKHKSPILRLTWIIKKKRERQNTLIEFPVLNQCADPEHTELKGGWIPLRKNPSILTEMHTVNISAFPKDTYSLSPCTGERK